MPGILHCVAKFARKLAHYTRLCKYSAVPDTLPNCSTAYEKNIKYRQSCSQCEHYAVYLHLEILYAYT